MERYGETLKLTLFGRSHGPLVGMTMTGLPSGLAVDAEKLQTFLNRRAPGRAPWSSPRREDDAPEFLSGLKDGKTTGGPLTAVIRNRDANPSDYENLKSVPRPGHADYPASVKYGPDGIESGGGRFSGRMTAPLCVAGGLCRQFLEELGISVSARVLSVGPVSDSSAWTSPVPEEGFPAADTEAGKRMIEWILQKKAEGDSCGGVIECRIDGLPAGIGGPLFGGMESRISEIVFAIPAVKGIEFGDGFRLAERTGSESNDAFCVKDGKILTETNHCGGLLGGMTDGMPVLFRVAVKPVPSVSVPQKSVDLRTGSETVLRVGGRHDPCIVPRAVPCAEAAAAIAVFDAVLSGRDAPGAAFPKEETNGTEGLLQARKELDAVDLRISELLELRIRETDRIGRIKADAGLPVSDPEREEAVLDRISSGLSEDVREDVAAVYRSLFARSRARQEELAAFDSPALSEGFKPGGKPAVLVLNGPNLDLLGVREPGLYGDRDYASLVRFIRDAASEAGVRVYCFQSNREDRLIERIHAARGRFDGIVINPAGYTHTSVALLDALKAAGLPCVEVHLTDVSCREPFRRVSLVREACLASVSGEGFEGYRKALMLLKDRLDPENPGTAEKK